MTEKVAQARVRLPSDAMDYVKAEAREAASSQNSVIVRAIRAAMKAKGPAGTAIPPSQEHDKSLQGKANEHAEQ